MPAKKNPQRVRRRLDSAALREKVLKTAVKMVGKMDVLTIGIEDLSMEQVIRNAKVPRSSVYRLWPYRGDFVDDVLVALASAEHMATLSADVDTIRGAEEELANASPAAFANAASRRALARQLIRVWALYDLKRLAEERAWQEYIALVAGTRFVRSTDARERLAIELQSRERSFIGEMATFYEKMATALGLRMRPGLDYRHLAMAIAAVLEGFALRRILVETTRDTPRRRLIDDENSWTLEEAVEQPLNISFADDPEPGEWHLAAAACRAILDSFTEDDPNYSPPDSVTTQP